MAEPATMDVVDALRKEMQAEIDCLRREVAELRLTKETGAPGARHPRPLAQRMQDLQKMREVREAILRERGGELLRPSAEEIRQMREERTAQILGEAAG